MNRHIICAEYIRGTRSNYSMPSLRSIPKADLIAFLPTRPISFPTAASVVMPVRMVKVDKGEWDKSRGPELNHEFNLEWLKRCQRVLKPNGTIWVSGTHHVIFSIGFLALALLPICADHALDTGFGF